MSSAPMLTGLPVVLRCGVLGSFVMAGAGGLAGLVVGLAAYPPTAWFAIFEVGVPAGVVGGVLGAAIGSSVWVQRKVRRARPVH